jgi:hypothetical protein
MFFGWDPRDIGASPGCVLAFVFGICPRNIVVKPVYALASGVGNCPWRISSVDVVSLG